MARFALLFLPVAAVLGAVLLGLYRSEAGAQARLVETEERQRIVLERELVLEDFRSVQSDVAILASDRSLRSLLVDPAARAAVEERFRTFAEHRALYDQVRLLDRAGREVVRVDLEHSRARVVPQAELQDKGERYYFRETLELGPGDVFVSRFDLNVENGVVEDPPVPAIRFATPLFDDAGERAGILVLNYRGAVLLGRLRSAAAGSRGEVLLVDEEGYFLAGPRPQDEWGFVFAERRERTLARLFPSAAAAAARATAGQVRSEAGLFTFEAVRPVGDAAPLAWTIVSRVPPEVLATKSLESGLARLYGLLLLVSAAASFPLARHAAERASARRRLLQAERLAAIGEAMTGLAHESRNALQRSQACIEMLAKRVPDGPEVGALLARLQGAQDDLCRLYETVRGYAAPVRLERRPCDLREPLAAAWDELEPARRGAVLRVHADGVEPRCSADPFALRRALANVLENALLAVEERARPVAIDARFTEERLRGAPAVALSIEDDGPGLSAEQAARAFEPFYTTRARGTGLGLAITKRIVLEHGGRIAARRGARGACIDLILPKAP